jgi:hypothetical protein
LEGCSDGYSRWKAVPTVIFFLERNNPTRRRRRPLPRQKQPADRSVKDEKAATLEGNTFEAMIALKTIQLLRYM